MPTPRPSPSRPPVTVDADATKMILHIRFRDTVRAGDLGSQLDLMRRLIAKMPRGFTLLTDLSGLREMEIDTVGELAAMMDQCLAAGVQQVVRVIPDPTKDIGFHLLSMTHYRGRVPVTTCETLAEAEKVLAQ